MGINVDNICEELILYGEKDEKTGRWPIYIVVDFDYTLTKESSWENGTFTANDHCFEVLLKWQEKYGAKYILETMRGPERIQPAIDFCKENGLEFYGIGRNPLQDRDGDKTCKAWGVFDIDDRNLGAYLVTPDNARPYVDWYSTEKYGDKILELIYNRLPEMEEEVLKKKALLKI